MIADSRLEGRDNLNPQNLAPVEIESIYTGFEFLSSMQ